MPPATAEAGPEAAGAVPAVGRLNHAGYRTRMHCTAALLGAREAVTARHCVEGVEPRELHLVLGYDRGAYAEHRRVASVETAPEADLARLCLDAGAGAAPLPASAERPDEAPAGIRGYPATRAHAQSERACALSLLPGEPLALLDCPLEQGFSGAPVTVGEGEAARVVGVVSASGEGRSLVALLASLPESGCPEP